jgi:hypothetical protein
VGSHDLAGIEGQVEVRFVRVVEPLRERPFGVRVVLRLGREEVPNDVGGLREPLPDEPLRGEPAGGDGGKRRRAVAQSRPLSAWTSA